MNHEILGTFEPVYWCDLTDDQRSDCDWMDEEEQESSHFIIHGSYVFTPSEFTVSESDDYDGTYSISAFSAFTLRRVSESNLWELGYLTN